MKRIYLGLIFLLVFCGRPNRDNHFSVGWGISLEGIKSKIFLSYGKPYFWDRDSLIAYYKVNIQQPLNRGVVIIPIKGNKGEVFYSIFCRIWVWEYVMTLPYLPKVLRFDPGGSITLEIDGKEQLFRRTILISSPALSCWEKPFAETIRL